MSSRFDPQKVPPKRLRHRSISSLRKGHISAVREGQRKTSGLCWIWASGGWSQLPKVKGIILGLKNSSILKPPSKALQLDLLIFLPLPERFNWLIYGYESKPWYANPKIAGINGSSSPQLLDLYTCIPSHPHVWWLNCHENPHWYVWYVPISSTSERRFFTGLLLLMVTWTSSASSFTYQGEPIQLGATSWNMLKCCLFGTRKSRGRGGGLL